MSGGVDSSVAALLLKEQGYRVIGMFMKNWEEKDESGVCRSAQDSDDAARVCEKIGIPYYAVEFVKEYWDHVFTQFLEEYRSGLTPNPDVLCNREIKFQAFFNKARELGADCLATGHYCQVRTQNGVTQLVKGQDPGKDQTYFLYAVSSQVLSNVLFPIGHLLKSEVREIAKTHGLKTHDKKDSTGICFIGERNFRNFLSQYLPAQSGEIKTLDGSRVGKHMGVAYYTLGQRKGLGLGGEGEAWFVVAKDVKKNILYVERGKTHPALYADELIAKDVSWVSRQEPAAFPFHCKAKVRYRQADQDCVLTQLENGRIQARFEQPQRALTPGQALVLYQGDVCLGGATIESVGPTYFQQQKPLMELLTRADAQSSSKTEILA